MITFAFVGLETITGIVLAALLLFLNVEKTISRKQGKIREYQREEAQRRGEEWIAPELRAAEEEQAQRLENEAAFAGALEKKCAKKGLDFSAELEKHNRAVSEKAAKADEKKRREAEKAERRAQAAQNRREERLAALSPEARRAMEEKAERRAAKEEAAWQRELAAGEAYRAKLSAELAKKEETLR